MLIRCSYGGQGLGAVELAVLLEELGHACAATPLLWEADVHWLYKRAQLDAALLGGARRHRAALARQAAEKARQLT